MLGYLVLATLGLATAFLPTIRLLNPPDIADGESHIASLFNSLRRRSEESNISTTLAETIVQASCDRGGDEGLCNPNGLRRVRTLLRMLALQQHPPKHSCSSSRLLVLQFPSSLEGLGSVIHTIVVALAEAMYSNRTVVWGLELTPLLERPRALWQAPCSRGEAAGCPAVHGLPLRCDWGGGGGAYNCLFEPLSTCSLADATWEELREAGDSIRGVDDGGRVRIMSRSRSPVAYAFPRGVFEPNNRSAAPIRHLWAAALGAYAFRLQPSVAAAFERKRQLIWPADPSADVAGMHVRHGDTTVQRYGNRAVHTFDDFFAALVRQASADCTQRQPHGGPMPCLNPARGPPAAIFIASDSTQLSAEIAAERERDRWRAGLPRGAEQPQLISSEDAGTPRFLTKLGAHTAAMKEYSCDDGSRASGTCEVFPDMDYSDLDKTEVVSVTLSATGESARLAGPAGTYEHEPRALHTPSASDSSDLVSARRVLRVMYEAAEDLYLLSYSTRIAATSSSRYGILAALLAWARSGGAVATGGRTLFLDTAQVASGAFEGSWLQQSFNGSKRCIIPQVRWHVCTAAWVSGIFNGLKAVVEGGPSTQTVLKSQIGLLSGDGTTPIRLPVMHQKDYLPTLPNELLWPEAARWALAETSSKPQRRVWGAECPLRPNDPDYQLPQGTPRFDDDLQVCASLWILSPGPVHLRPHIPAVSPALSQRSAALDHGAWAHVQQASICFQAGVDAADRDPYVDRASVVSLKRVTQTNIIFMEQTYLFPFSYPSEKMATLALSNLDLAREGVTLNISLHQETP